MPVAIYWKLDLINPAFIRTQHFFRAKRLLKQVIFFIILFVALDFGFKYFTFAKITAKYNTT